MATNEQVVKIIPKRTHSYNNAPLDSNNGRRNNNPVTPNDIHITDTGIVREKQGKVYYNTNPEGAEEVRNGNFYTNKDWTISSGITFSAGNILFDNSNDNLFQSFADVLGKTYKISITKTGSGTLRFRTGYAGTDGTKRPFSNSGVAYFTSTSDTNRIQIYGAANSDEITLHSVSVREVISNTASLYLEVLIRDEFNNLVSMVRNSNEGDTSTGSYENNQGVHNRPVPITKRVNGRTSRNIDSNGQPTL